MTAPARGLMAAALATTTAWALSEPKPARSAPVAAEAPMIAHQLEPASAATEGNDAEKADAAAEAVSGKAGAPTKDAPKTDAPKDEAAATTASKEDNAKLATAAKPAGAADSASEATVVASKEGDAEPAVAAKTEGAAASIDASKDGSSATKAPKEIANKPAATPAKPAAPKGDAPKDPKESNAAPATAAAPAAAKDDAPKGDAPKDSKESEAAPATATVPAAPKDAAPKGDAPKEAKESDAALAKAAAPAAPKDEAPKSDAPKPAVEAAPAAPKDAPKDDTTKDALAAAAAPTALDVKATKGAEPSKPAAPAEVAGDLSKEKEAPKEAATSQNAVVVKEEETPPDDVDQWWLLPWLRHAASPDRTPSGAYIFSERLQEQFGVDKWGRIVDQAQFEVALDALGLSRTTPLPTTTPDSSCFVQNAAYLPLDLLSQPMTYVDDAVACQAHCRNAPGCAHFTFSMVDRSCHITDGTYLEEGTLSSIAGPAICRSGLALSQKFDLGAFAIVAPTAAATAGASALPGIAVLGAALVGLFRSRRRSSAPALVPRSHPYSALDSPSFP